MDLRARAIIKKDLYDHCKSDPHRFVLVPYLSYYWILNAIKHIVLTNPTHYGKIDEIIDLVDDRKIHNGLILNKLLNSKTFKIDRYQVNILRKDFKNLKAIRNLADYDESIYLQTGDAHNQAIKIEAKFRQILEDKF